jgi:hypothetical protein
MKILMPLALGLALLGGGCSGAATGDTATGGATEQRPAQVASPLNLKIAGRQSVGQKMKVKNTVGDVETLEAAGAWMAVMVNVKNTSGSRQSVKGTFFFNQAELTDNRGAVHMVDWKASGDSMDTFEEKPMDVGEVRSVKLVFDLPSGTAAGELKINGYDAQRNIQEFQVS